MPAPAMTAGVAVRPVVAAVVAVAVAGGADAAAAGCGRIRRRPRPACRSSMPRSSRSAIRAERPASSIGPDWFFIRSVRPAWMSHEWLSELATLGQMTSTTRVPASTSRRASRQLWPNVLRP